MDRSRRWLKPQLPSVQNQLQSHQSSRTTLAGDDRRWTWYTEATPPSTRPATPSVSVKSSSCSGFSFQSSGDEAVHPQPPSPDQGCRNNIHETDDPTCRIQGRNVIRTTLQVSYHGATSVSTTILDPAIIFDSPSRKPLKIDPFKALFNILFSFGLVAALIAGYAIGLSVFDLGVTSVGLYGTIFLLEYAAQVCSAIANRIQIDRIARHEALRMRGEMFNDCFDNEGDPARFPGPLSPEAQVSIAVVGYREDEHAWRQCLRSLQDQMLRPKCIVGVVDGDEEPDLIMANVFADEFRSMATPVIRLPLLLSDLHRNTYFNNVPTDNRSLIAKAIHYISGGCRPGHVEALALARQAVINQVLEWDKKWSISSMRAVCFSQPHGHKRTAMFTAFAVSLWALRTRNAIFTTDSDTLVQNNALEEMLTVLHSSPDIGGVTADVKIWNRAESLLTRLCAARYWFAFNIERACQSTWRCVGCLSGPMSMYRSSDLDEILGLWNLQTFGGKSTTFGDDRHLTNQLLALGLKTRYTHRTWCESESPTTFVRWISQQTRWSKSFFREAFWFPLSFAYQAPWLLLETTIQTLYPFILIATIFDLLFSSSDNAWRPLIWVIVMFSLAVVKCLIALCICFDPWLLLFSIYSFIYFFGLLPTKLWALLTMDHTGWGTSARSSAERRRGQSFWQRSFHVGHLAIWYTAIFVGLGFFISRLCGKLVFLSIGAIAFLLTVFLYWGSVDWEKVGCPVKKFLKIGNGRESHSEASAFSVWSTKSYLERPPKAYLGWARAGRSPPDPCGEKAYAI
ncbi:hypothetical protein CBER1_04725 [Cercospora berteroae]|uniref:Glycosyltransferase 2-like domain-containing protein n=1 Tax=Cercospora berteroae TaxID=357750 RepID=A0A2S6BR48_9PEZI|nr:hypothetical protein CBER1_04725 [Cercospora berteroae]